MRYRPSTPTFTKIAPRAPARKVSMRGGRSKFKGKDGDSILYREGEPLRDLSKYLGPEGQEGQSVEVRGSSTPGRVDILGFSYGNLIGSV